MHIAHCHHHRCSSHFAFHTTGALSIKKAFHLSAQLQGFTPSAGLPSPLVVSSSAVKVPSGGSLLIPARLQPPWYTAGTGSPWQFLGLRLVTEPPPSGSGKGGKGKVTKCFHPLVAISSAQHQGAASVEYHASVEYLWANLSHIGLEACGMGPGGGPGPLTCSVLLLLDPTCGYTLSLAPDLALAFPQLLLGRMTLLIITIQAVLLFALAHALTPHQDLTPGATVLDCITRPLMSSPW